MRFRNFIAVFLLAALMLSTFSRQFIYAGFELNQKYISSTLCENRDKPELHCNGKCYLAKKLKQAEEKEKKQEQDGQKKSFQEHCILKTTVSLPALTYTQKRSASAEISSVLPVRNTEVLVPPPTLFS